MNVRKPSMTGRASRTSLTAIGLVFAACALLLAACGSSTKTSSSSATAGSGGTTNKASTSRIAFFSDSDDNAWVQAGIKAGKDTAAKNGVQMDVFSAGWDSSKQLTQVQDAISSGKYNAYVVEAIDGQTVCKPLTDVMKTGATVSVFNTPLCGNTKAMYTAGTVGYFGRDEYQGGKLLGEQMALAVGKTGKVAYISGPVANTIVQLTTQGFKDGLAEYPNVQLVAELDGNWDAAKGLAATQDLMQAHPDVAGIAYGVDQMMVPSVNWLKDTNKLANIKIVTEGGSSNAFTMIQAGQVQAAVAGLPYTEAANGTQAAIDALNGVAISVPGWDATAKTADYLKAPIFKGGAPVITTANVATFTPEWAAA